MRLQLATLLCATVVAIITTLTGHAQGISAAPFQNGSFEIPGQSVLGTKVFLGAGDARLTGWTIGGTGGPLALYNGPLASEIFPAPDGVSHLLFNGGGGAAGASITQTFKTEPGTNYVVTFLVGRLGSGAGALSVTATAKSDNGTALATFKATPPQQGYGQAQIMRFTATSTQTTLEFIDTSTGDISSQDLALDAVAVLAEPGLTIRVSAVQVCWSSEQGKTYQLQYQSTVTGDQWVNLGDAVLGDGTEQCVSDAVVPDAPKRFYRVVTTL